MKPKSNPFLRHAALFLSGSIVLSSHISQAASGTWNVDADGLWSLNTNWLSNTIADGSGFTASFTNNITADRTVHLDGDRTLTSLVFSDSNTATAGSWILDNNGTSTNNLILAGTTPTITVNTLGTDKTATISAIIEGSAGLTKAGAGTLVLSGANTYTGGTKVSVGILSVSSDGNFGATAAANAITLNGGTLQTTAGFTLNANHGLALATATTSTIDTGANNLATASAVTGSGNLIKTGSGKLTFGASTTAHSNSGNITVLNGTLEATRNNGLSTTALGSGTIYLGDSTGSNPATLNWLGYGTYSNNIIVQTGSSGTKTISKNTTGGSNNSSTLSGTLTLDDNVTISNTINNTNTFTFSNTISGSGGISFSGTTGANVLSGANTYTGATSIQAGILSVASLNYVTSGNWATHASSSLGAPTTVANGTIAIGNTATAGQLTYTGSGETTDRVIDLAGTTGGATIDQSGTNLLKFTNAFTATGGGVKTLTLQGSTAGTGEINAAIVDNSGTNKTSLTKAGTGTWTLSGTNTYTGLTTVSAGTLALTGTNGGNSNIVLSNNVTLAFNSGSALGTGSLLGQNGGGANYGTGVTYQTLGTSPISIGLSTAAGIRTASNADVNIKFTSGAGSTAAVTWTTDFLIYSVAGPQTIAVDNIGGVTFSGANFKVGTGAATATTSLIKGSQPVTISGVVSKGNGTDLSLTYAGSSTLTLSNGANAYTGATTVQSGSVVVGANAPSAAVGALGNASSAIVLGNASTAASGAPSLLINGSFTVGRDISVGSASNTAAYNATIGGSNTSGTSTYTGNITLNTTASAYTATLQAATGGTVEFKTGAWTTNNKAIAIGAPGNTGTVKLSNNLATTGGVNVKYGTLVINGATITGNLTADTNTTISGTGSIVGNTTINGNLSPGNSPGYQSYGGNLTLGSTAITNFELSGTTRSTLALVGINYYDAIDVTGTLTLDGTINVSWLDSFSASNGDSFNLFDWSSISATGFNMNADLSLPTLAGGLTWDTTSFLSNGTITVVPEPNVAALLGGLGLLALLRRRRA